jgi:4-amino-4-deoxy-L-arabinose transferase-like glycosyltransferase
MHAFGQQRNGVPIVVSRHWEWLWLGVILLVALLLRLYRLDAVPPGLTHDEAANGQSAIGVLEEERPIYFTIANGREPLYPYSMAPVVALLGSTEIAVRLTSVLWGLALILVTWAWVREAFDPLTALLAAAGLSVGFWPLMVSRLGLRAVTLPVLFTGAVYFLWRAVYRLPKSATRGGLRLWKSGYVLAGLLLGVSFYTYMASRVLPLVWVLFLLYLALFYRRQARAVWRGILGAVLLAVVVAAPLLFYLRAHPQAEARIDQLAEPWRQAQAGDWEPLRRNAVAALKIFTFDGAGDPHWIYNISGRPLLDPLGGGLFYAGLLLALGRWRDPAHFFLLAWLIAGLAPVYVTGANSVVVRAVAVQPTVFVLQALALRQLMRWLNHEPIRIAGHLSSGLIMLIVAIITVQAYFADWPNQRDVRVAYHTTLVEIARHLDAQSEGGTAVISSIYPDFPHDPYSFDLTSHRDDLAVRWFDGRSTLIFPDVDEAYAVFPALAPLDAALEPFFEPYAQLLDRVTLRADDLNPWFEVYRWRPRAAVERLPLTESVDVGHILTFAGHQLRTPTTTPGGTIELLTFWQVSPAPGPQSPVPSPQFVFFTHVLDPANQIVGQQDRLDAPAWNWSPGDLIVQLHRFSVDAGLAAGLYPLEVGVYLRAEGYPRLPVYGTPGAPAVADHILLPPVEVIAP